MSEKMTNEDKRANDAARRRTLKSIKAKRDIRIKQINEEAKQKIRELNIQYAKNPERLKAKYAAADYAKSEKEKRRAAALIEKEKKYLDEENSLRDFTLGERIFSGNVQGLGTCAQIALLVLFLVFQPLSAAALPKSANFALYSCFSASVICAFLFSLLHYALENLSAKGIFKRLSRAAVFVAIAIFYSFFTYNLFPTAVLAMAFLSCVHVICLLGVVLYSIFSSRIERLCTAFFIFLGIIPAYFAFSGVLTGRLSAALLIAIVGFTLSAVLFNFRKIKYAVSLADLIMLPATLAASISFFML